MQPAHGGTGIEVHKGVLGNLWHVMFTTYKISAILCFSKRNKLSHISTVTKLRVKKLEND